MGMIGNLKRISLKVLDILKNNPSVIGEFTMASLMKSEMIHEIKEKNPDDFNILSEEIKTPNLCLQKDWQAIHFLLTGEIWEVRGSLGKAVLGGKEIGEDLGYGPVRYLMPEEVKEVSEELSNVSESEIRAKFDAKKMIENGIYPGHWELDYVDGIADLFKEIRVGHTRIY